MITMLDFLVVAFMAHYGPVGVFEWIILEGIFEAKAGFDCLIAGKHKKSPPVII